MRFICPRLRLSEETHTHKYTCFSCCAALRCWGVWLQAPGPSGRLQNGEPLASVQGRRPLPPGRRSWPPASSQRELPLCAQAWPPGPGGAPLEKQQDAGDSLLAVSGSKTHLSSPEETHAFPGLGGRSVPCAGTGELAGFPELFFMDTRWRI